MKTQTGKRDFNYRKAFWRNLGFISVEDQKRLRSARIAIAGLGGVGGAQLLCLARMGIGNFALADPDIFEVSNFNRQLGATVDSIGRKKADVWREIVLSINPTAKIKTLTAGVREDTIDEFLKGADLVLDALDTLCFDERFLLYRKARDRGLWVLTAPPLGFGCSMLLFDPDGMTFEDYFDIRREKSVLQKIFTFFYGLAPSHFALKYLDVTGFNPMKNRLPCISPPFFVIAGMSASEAVNLLLQKRPPQAVPWVHEFDPFLHRYRKRRYPFGMRCPWHRTKKWILVKLFKLG